MGHLTPLQRQVLTQGYLDIKEQEYEAKAEMMGGGQSGPTAGSVRNGASSGPSSGGNRQVEEKSFVNPDAGDPLENVDDE